MLKQGGDVRKPWIPRTPPPHQHTRTIHTTAYPTRHSPPSCGHAWGHTLRRVSLLLRFVRVFDAADLVRVFDTATGGSDTPSPPTFRTGVRRTGVRISDTSTVRTGVRIRYATYRIAVCWCVGWYVCSGDCVLPVFSIPCISLLSYKCSLFRYSVLVCVSACFRARIAESVGTYVRTHTHTPYASDWYTCSKD